MHKLFERYKTWNSYINRHYPVLIWIFLSIAVLINIRPEYTIMGLDNGSPFFSFETLWYHIQHSSNFFEFGPLLYTPSIILTFFSIPAWVVSHIFYWGSFFIGCFFIIKLVEKAVIVEQITRFKGIIVILGLLFVLSSLIPLWIYSQPIVLFASAFAGIPAFIHFITTDRQDKTLLLTILESVGILFLFGTSINPVAFGFFIVTATIVSIAWLNDRSEGKNAIIKAITILGVWAIVTQFLILLSSHRVFLPIEIVSYGQEIAQDPKSQEVTESLLAAEIQRNSLTNVVRSATSWMLLNKGEGERIFELEPLYDSIPFVLMGILPPLVIIATVYQTKKKSRRTLFLLSLWIVAQILISGYTMNLLRFVPIVNQILRWSSTKLWALSFFPLIFLLPTFFSEIVNLIKKKSFLFIAAFCVIVMSMVGTSFPWWTGNVVSNTVFVKIPQAYTEIPMPEGSNVLVVPQPQRLYMKEYLWGYFGTDFHPYLQKANFISNGGFMERHHRYSEYLEQYRNCQLLESSDTIDFVIFDNNVKAYDEKEDVAQCYTNAIEWSKDGIYLIRIH
ncbi:MAG: hypothetical protein QY314_03670 [Candidatus Dojkabacteria bacterium]|nr:MAG: hypothetical protein QY314_03670 [Candidatus Dojkabacteria bacterium]